MSAGEDDIKHARFDQARVATLIRETQPDAPLALLRPHALIRTAQVFQRGFPGTVSYAVKANPAPEILSALTQAGITTFDVASVAEMHAARQACPTARLHYHNPVRSLTEIAAAKALGIASWSVDRLSELDKLGDLPPDTEIAVRLTLRRGGGAYDFGSKFGASPEDATALLKEVAARGLTPALTFHPGTQCTDASSWADYIAACATITRNADVRLAALNVGGGFPAVSGTQDDTLARIFTTIRSATAAQFQGDTPRLWCEPGRAMVADALWLLLRVKARSGDALYLNDGLYGALGEWRDMPVPAQHSVFDAAGQNRSGTAQPFTIFGPTCDSLDRVPGTWDLPADTGEQDHILLTGAGAYSLALVTGFNGYGTRHMIDLSDWREEAGQHGLAG
ncbi:MAG: alanine racemase [Pelagibaca sp.]